MNTPESIETAADARHSTPAPGSRLDLAWEPHRTEPNCERGYFKKVPDTTIFLLRARKDKPHRGTLYGAVIPDWEDGKEHNENALVSYLKGVAAPIYVERFFGHLLSSENGKRSREG
jgi:hypothetical protein